MTRPTRIALLGRVVVVALVALALTAPLAACGKRGNLEAPEEEKVPFPRKYPR
jgi:predicted small lipoprotein YifL